MRLACAKPHVRNSPDGPDSCEITRAITLVSSHDWHVQPFCQRPDSTPPERRFSGTPGFTSKGNPGAPRNLLSHLRPKAQETNLSNLPRVAAFCQCGFLWKSGANLFCHVFLRLI